MNSASGSLWEWTLQLPPNARAGLAFFSLIALIAIVSIIAATVYQMHKNRLEHALKRELLDRGMTADEIATVMGKAKDE